MNLGDYQARLRTIKLAAKKMQDAKKLFLASDVTKTHIHTHEARLKEIRDKLETFNEAVSDLIVDLDEHNADDKAKIASLETLEANLLGSEDK